MGESGGWILENGRGLIALIQFFCYFLFYQERNQGVGWNWVEWASREGGFWKIEAV
jgi:hypothetical protein